jgi:hypothetical protein
MAPKYTAELLVKELSKELQTTLNKMACKYLNIDVMKTLARHLNAYITGTLLPAPEQVMEQRVVVLLTHRVNNNANPPTYPNIQMVSNTLITPLANNPTSEQVLQMISRTHQHLTWHNTPGAVGLRSPS